MQSDFQVSGQLVDIHQKKIYPAEVKVKAGKIYAISPLEKAPEQYLMPGFIDAHIHIESSMVSPAAFSRTATQFGTVATISDPHEIANVCGKEGVYYMIENARKATLKIHFGAPSCVPATHFETSGATLDASTIAELMELPDIYYLAEMMNFPGVLHGDEEILKKIAAAHKNHKPVDGHAPGLRGAQAKKYIEAGISTDHECTTLEEALDKLKHGMKILIREGSAAKNFEALHPLFNSHPQELMFCSDDKHPDELVKGHINELVKRALKLGYPLFDVLHAACIAPIEHYNIPVGSLRIGEPADFIIVEDLENFNVKQCFINGACVVENGKNLEDFQPPRLINNFNREAISAAALQYEIEGHHKEAAVRVIEAVEGQLVTHEQIAQLPIKEGEIYADIAQDILKIAVVNRYAETPPAIGFIKNFGLKRGALASSVAHDSHNIVVVGVDDEDMAAAVNLVIEQKGGVSVACSDEFTCMPLPIGGLMTNVSVEEAASQYEAVDAAAKKLGCTLKAPFMTLSFMALPVIPDLKMTDKGLFDVAQFGFVDLVKP